MHSNFYFLLSLIILLCTAGCQKHTISPPRPDSSYQFQLSFHYENLLTGTTGKVSEPISGFARQFTSLAYAEQAIDSFLHNLTFTYALDTTSTGAPSGPQHFSLRFSGPMAREDAEPVPGQYYGQLMTFRDRERYLTDLFPPGPAEQLTRSYYLQHGSDYADASPEDTAAGFDNQLILTHSKLFTDAAGRRHVYLEGRFKATLLHGGYTQLLDQPHFQLSNGRFSGFFPVDGQ